MMKFSLLIRNLYKNTLLGYYLIHPIKIIYDFIAYKMIPPEIFIKMKFKKVFDFQLDLTNPKTLNEKIQWLKLYKNNSELHTRCTDKYEVKQFITETIGASYVVPLVSVTDNYKDIKFENVPDFPVIIKATHNSGGYVVIKDKDSVNWKKLHRECKKWLAENYYYIGKEQQYKNIQPRLIIEKLLFDNEGNTPMDYKVHCFNGIPQMIQVDLDRGTPKHCRNWYSTDWQREPYSWASLYPDGKLTNPSNEDVPRPNLLPKMLELSERLSSMFTLVRVDWYILNEKLYFGELTFHHDGGFRPILPKRFDLILGNKLKLPI